MLQQEKFDSVVDRYYTRYYKPMTAIESHRALFPDNEFKDGDEEAVVDQYYFEHSNHLVLFGLRCNHDLFAKIREGVLDVQTVEILFSKGKKDRGVQL